MRGLQAFASMPGMSSDPAHVTNQGYDSSTGVGLRLGYQGALGENVRVGAAWSPRVEMGRFEKYQGLFAGQGGFDLPENVNLGVAWQASPCCCSRSTTSASTTAACRRSAARAR